MFSSFLLFPSVLLAVPDSEPEYDSSDGWEMGGRSGVVTKTESRERQRGAEREREGERGRKGIAKVNGEENWGWVNKYLFVVPG
jgi:hypothetical protein